MKQTSTPDDLLTRAETALQRLSTPDEPSPKTMARTLAALKAAGPNRLPYPRRKLLPRVLQIATAVLVFAGGLLFFGGVLPEGATVAFAEVAQKLHDAHALAFNMTVRSANVKEPSTTRFLFKKPGWMRLETAGGHTTITDMTKDRTLILDSKAKTAIHMHGEKSKPAEDIGTQTLAELWQLVDKHGELVGKKQIGDALAHGFRVKEGRQELTIWADPKKKLPLLVETTVRVANQEAQVSLSDFELNPKLDDGLFNMEPPEAYKVLTVQTVAEKPEDALVRVLTAYTKKSGGTFPERLDDWGAIIKEPFRDEKFAGPLPDPKFMQIMQSLGGLTPFLMDPNHVYRPAGAKLGEAAKIIFWYRPEGAVRYRVVFADLRISDVTADQLPMRPK